MLSTAHSVEASFMLGCRVCRARRVYHSAEEYGTALLNRLGRLNPRFFDLFVKAYGFRDVENVEEFVLSYLLDPAPIDIEKMQKTRERLAHLEAIAQRVSRQIAALDEIMQAEVRRVSAARVLRTHDFIVRSADQEMASDALQSNLDQQHAYETKVAEKSQQIQVAQRTRDDTEHLLEETQAILRV